jgi:hypothetical protein
MKAEDHQRFPQSGAIDELVEGFDHRVLERARGIAGHLRLAREERQRHAGQHEQRGDDEDLQPGQAVGQDQRERARHQPGDAVGIDMHRVAQAQLLLGEDLAPVGVERDVLGRREQRHRGRQPEYRHNVAARREQAERGDRRQQADLRDQHPAAAAAADTSGRRVAVEQRRPEELPGVGKLDQGEEADGLEVHALRTQPGRHQVEQQIERQAGREAGEHADQHAPGEQRGEPGRHQDGLNGLTA